MSKENKLKPFNRKGLAQFMAASSPDYLTYEYEDFIDVFTTVIEKLIKEGNTIALDGFGSFKPKYNPSFRTASLTSDETVTYPASQTMKFTPAVSLQKRIKEYTKEKANEVS